MKEIDARSLILGVLFCVTAAVFYETVFHSLLAKTIYTNSLILASLVTITVTGVYFWIFFIRGKNGNGFELTQKTLVKNKEEKENKQLEQPEESEQEKLKREFKHRIITKTDSDEEDVCLSLSVCEIRKPLSLD